jgi:hypothetical protein
MEIPIADQLGDAARENVVALAAIEHRDVVASRERITNLIWSGESRAAKDENVERSTGASGRVRARRAQRA